MVITQRLALDVTRDGGQGNIILVRGEAQSRQLLITLRAGNAPVGLEDGVTAAIRGIKPDGGELFNACVVYTAAGVYPNTVVYHVTEATVAAAGVYSVRLVLWDRTGAVLWSPEFSVTVKENGVAESGLGSRDEFTMIIEAERVTSEASVRAVEAAELATEAANGVSEAATTADEAAREAEAAAEEAKEALGLLNGEVDRITPHIGENGNWYVGETDTGSSAVGPEGRPGNDGKDGDPGKDGTNGTNGQDGQTPEIGENGNWFIGGVDTGKPSRGENGQKGELGERGYSGVMPLYQETSGAIVTVTANTMVVLSPLEESVEIYLGEPQEEGYDDEWAFVVTQGAQEYDVVLPEVAWTLGIAPVFAAGTTTEVRLHYRGEVLEGVWNG